jgi:hypothetical protein
MYENKVLYPELGVESPPKIDCDFSRLDNIL